MAESFLAYPFVLIGILFTIFLILCLCARKQKTPAESAASTGRPQKPLVAGQSENIHVKQLELYDELFYDTEGGNKSPGKLALIRY